MPALEATNYGKYIVTRTLGEGAMGVVYAAYDPTLDRHVALKIIRKDLLDRREATAMIARFRNEAMAAGRLQHPGIVAVHDFGEDEQTSFIVMELAVGEDLEAFARRYAPLGMTEVSAIMSQLLDALHYAHAAGVVHRDIKPTNAIVTNDGKLKITDFGIARIATTKLTQTGTMLGTPMYMAPEQYTGLGVDHLADLFSAGVVLYELLTGKRPFDGDTVHEVAYKICQVDPPPPSAHNPRVSPAMDAVALRALAKNKAQRFQTGHELSHAIHAASGPGARPLPVTPAISMTSVFAPETLKALEAAMAPFMGPLAGTLVKRTAARTRDANELVDLLSRGDGTDPANPALHRALSAIIGAQTNAIASGTSPAARPPTQPGAGASVALSPELLDKAANALVTFVGPIAKVLVKKTAASARDYRDLLGKLCEHLASDQERAQFMKRAS